MSKSGRLGLGGDVCQFGSPSCDGGVVGDEAVVRFDAFEGLDELCWLEHRVLLGGEAAQCFEAVLGFESGEVGEVSGFSAGDEGEEFVAGEIELVEDQAVGCVYGRERPVVDADVDHQFCGGDTIATVVGAPGTGKTQTMRL